MLSQKVQLERECEKLVARVAAYRKAIEAWDVIESLNGTAPKKTRRLSKAGRLAISRAVKARHAANRLKKRKKNNG